MTFYLDVEVRDKFKAYVKENGLKIKFCIEKWVREDQIRIEREKKKAQIRLEKEELK